MPSNASPVIIVFNNKKSSCVFLLCDYRSVTGCDKLGGGTDTFILQAPLLLVVFIITVSQPER